jgi:hypothetical protein
LPFSTVSSIEILVPASRVQDLDVVPGFDCTRPDLARTAAAQPNALRAFAVHAQPDAFHIEDDVGHVLEHAGDRREFVQHALDLHRGHSSALQRRQQHPAQRVAERQTETAFKRFGDDGGDAGGIIAGLDFELGRLF